jgi:hypothetical protein
VGTVYKRFRDDRGGTTVTMMNPLAGPAGPGKFSTRTDKLEMGSTAYGEGVETQAIKSGAALASTPDVKGTPASAVRQAALTPLYAPTERPDIPVTEGIDMGAGAGSEALMMRQEDDTNFRTAISEYMPVLNFISDQPNTSPETRAAIKRLMDNL